MKTNEKSFSEHLRKPNFWERGNRVVILASGGAFLGVLLAQLPGAIVGWIVIAIYAWFTTPNQREYKETEAQD
jgi:hypothetical protein